MKHRLGPYGTLAAWVLARRRAVGAALVLITVVCGALTSRLGVDANLLSMLPEDVEEVVALRALHAEEGGANLITIAFKGDDPQRLDAYLDELVGEMSRAEGVQYAIHEVDPALTLEIGLLQLDPEDVDELSRRLKGALALGPALNPLVVKRLMDLGPVAERIAKTQAPSFFQANEGTGRILVKPTGSAHDLPFAAAVMGEVHRVLDAHPPAPAGAELQWIGGAYRHATEDRDGIVDDLTWTTIVSTLLVVAMIAVAFRSWRSVVLFALPLVTANLVQLAAVWALYGTLNTYTSIGSAILIGLGIDYPVHLVGRYREERSLGATMEDAICRSWDKVGPPCATACMTSIAGFLALTTADFRGFSQLGVMLALGLGTALVVMLVALPVLIPMLDAGAQANTRIFGLKRSEAASRSTYRLAPLGLMIAVVVTTLAATRLPPDFQYDISELRQKGLAYDELAPEAQALARDSYSPVLVDYADATTLREEQARIVASLAANPLPHVATVASIENVLPTDMDARVAALRDLASLLDHPNLKYLPPPLVTNLGPLRGWDGDGLTRAQLPPAVTALLAASDAEEHRLLIFPSGNMWDLAEAAMFRDEVTSLVGGHEAVGEYTALGAMYGIIRHDVPVMTLVAALLVAALTVIDLRKPMMIVGGLGALVAGVVWAGVIVDAAGISFSIVNVVAVPMLVGLGVDVVVHLLHRLEEEGPGGVRHALATTGMAAFLSTATNAASFASLAVAGNRGVQSLGLLTVIGLSVMFGVAAAVLPLAWAAGWRISGRAPGHRKHHHPRKPAPSPGDGGSGT